MHEEHGVKFYLNAGVKEIVGEGGKVTGVTLPSGETLEAEVVVAGVGEPLTSSFTLYIVCLCLPGVAPATQFLKDSGLPLNRKMELVVDKVSKCLLYF